MIHSLTTVVAELGASVGQEVTIRCRVQSDPMPGETGGDKTVYLVDDPVGEIDDEVALSFWTDEPSHPDLQRTASYIRSTLGIPTTAELERGDYSPDGSSLQRGEELLVRAIPNRSPETETLFLNVTSFVIRGPDRLISKSKLRTQDRCPREYYLRYVKRVYPGDKFDSPPHQQANRFRGDAIHKITENAVLNHLDRFIDETWDRDSVESFCADQFAAEFGFRQALLVLTGAGLDSKDHVVEAITHLFTDDGFLERIQSATEVDTERFLASEYGYAGRVDLLLDGVPYDIKTTRNPDDRIIATHSRQVKLYLFALLLEELEGGESFRGAIEDGPTGYLIYPNTSDETVRFEQVILTLEDVQEFLDGRNAVIETGDAFAPPSTYNRECDGCAFAVEEWISGEDDTLPPACTYHCQNERRWPCYEIEGDELTTQCSLFDGCDQRTEYRNPAVIDHFERTRAAFQEERDTRRTAKQVVDRFDDDLLVAAGYRIPDLTCIGAAAAGTVIRFTTTEPVIPAFDPGDVVELQSADGTVRDRVIYYGMTDGAYSFTPVDESLDVSDYLEPDTAYEVTYTFAVESVDERYLPYLDFAQRRNDGRRLRSEPSSAATDDLPDSIDPSTITTYLDREQVFVDLPVSRNHSEVLAELVRELVTSSYPSLDGDGDVPAEGRRALVLGTNPDLVECAAGAQPAGDHYRLDGTGGPSTIQNEDGYHSIQERLLDSRSVVSSVQQATTTRGPGGIREFFHRLTEGSFGNRSHSDNFFDVLVILGAERLTEPEYYFLSDIADRVVAVGDTRRKGPRMISATASEAGLDVFFQQEFERYRSFPTEQAVSVQLQGEAPPGLKAFYQEGPWEEIDGDLTFLNVQGDEETAVETVELETSVPAAAGVGRRLVFDVTDTPLSPLEAHNLFEDRIELDSTALKEDAIVVLDDESLYLQSKERLEGDNPTHHQVVIRTVASELPQFSRALLSNDIAEKIVTNVVTAQNPDVVVTPFERHATQIKRHLAEAGIDVPVRRPEDLDGTITDHAVVSLATANETGIVRPPLDDPAILYALLSSAQDLTLVGNERTLSSKDIFEKLIHLAQEY